MSLPYELIETAGALAQATQRMAACTWLAIDTEFVREETYYPKLCLVQVWDGQNSICVDTLAIADLKPLWDLLRNESVLKVLHAAGQDLEIFTHVMGDCPRPLFDTQIAAALLGYGEQLGYAAVVERMLGIPVDKSLSRTDWARRPLGVPELTYAADDVRHLAEIFPRLKAELEGRGRLGWLQEDCTRQADARLYRTHPEDAWRKVKGLFRLSIQEQAMAARFAAWREQVAVERNRPRRWILEDEHLCAIVQRRPATLEEFAALVGIPRKIAQRHADAWLRILSQEPGAGPAVTYPEPLKGPERARFKALQDKLRQIAEREKVVPTLIANREDLEKLVREGTEAKILLLQGWRRLVAGEELLAALA